MHYSSLKHTSTPRLFFSLQFFSIHIDPLGTSAWNTLLVGHKRWCMFPPSCPRFLSDPSLKPLDHEAVTWFEHVFPRFLQRDPTSECTLGEKYGMVQCLQGPGETMFVPGGWAHVVMNLGGGVDSVAARVKRITRA
ncbi:hypothetical protein BC937DRAFT_87335 [Endogone sp. FLAS-F59071]|nr:hypothetical protein BC937DRAFT_87335 [Endogone sp. FLAS-F59071]|eukprot:RUS12643.1 hypothetical protein BC937DRAFT_87335 [Endogone sp. FLAS-F59071]